jgi:hypothetical protein
VWEILDNDVAIKKDLERGIINVSALSEYILETYKIQGSLDSVISSVRRYKVNDAMKDDYAKITAALKEGVISTKTNISLVTLGNTGVAYKYIGQIMANEDFLKNDVFRLIKTRHEVQIVVDRDSMARAKDFFPESAVEEIRKNLVEISVHFTKKWWDTKGIMSRITNELASQGVNIIMIFSVYPTTSIFVEEKDLRKTCSRRTRRLSG